MRWVALAALILLVCAALQVWVRDATYVVTVQGVVTTEGAPVVGATVWAETVTEGSRVDTLLRNRRVEATTDAAGRYSLEVPGELGVRIGAWNAAGHGSTWTELQDLLPGETLRVDISIRRQ